VEVSTLGYSQSFCLIIIIICITALKLIYFQPMCALKIATDHSPKSYLLVCLSFALLCLCLKTSLLLDSEL